MSADLNLYLLLKQVAQTQPNVRLLNVYKGLPISHEASISAISDSEVHVHSDKYQLACLYYQQETYLQGAEFPFTIRSQVMSLHLGREDAILSDLEVAPQNVGHREQIRVEPEEPLVALIQFNGVSMGIAAPVADISVEGAGIYLEPYMYSPRLCQPGSQVSISITLPDTASQKLKKVITRPLQNMKLTGGLPADASVGSAGTVVITTVGKVVSVRSELVRYRVGLRLFFKDLARSVILQYISQRQSEIIRDLSILSDELYKKKAG